jgi:hypothetical protein
MLTPHEKGATVRATTRHKRGEMQSTNIISDTHLFCSLIPKSHQIPQEEKRMADECLLAAVPGAAFSREKSKFMKTRENFRGCIKKFSYYESGEKTHV